MKILAFNGSPRKGGNTEILLKTVLKEIESEGIETELVQLGGNLLRGCTACYACAKNQDKKCVFDDDMMNECIAKMIEADGIVIGSPSYFSNVSTEVKALIDRAGVVCRANGGLLHRKIGASVCAQRRSGGTNVQDTISKLFFISGMVVPGSTYWNFGVGKDKGEVLEDTEGMANMADLGKNIAWLAKKLA